MENLNKFIGVECTIDSLDKDFITGKHPIVIVGISKRTEHFNAEVWFKLLDNSHPNFNEGDNGSEEIAKFFDRAEFTLDEKTGALI